MATHEIKYSNVWEDADLLARYLSVDQGDVVMSIASGGDNSLHLLGFDPGQMICVDMNEEQIFLTQLKEEAIRQLDQHSFLSFVGITAGTPDFRIETYQRIRPNLPSIAQAYFEHNPDIIRKGITDCGKFEKYFRLFSNRILPLIHSRKTVNGLFDEKTEEEQKNYYKSAWNTWRWRLFFKFFFSRFIMGSFGREPEKLKQVEQHVGSYIFDKAEQHLSSVSCQHNYILRYALTGAFLPELPPYLVEENYNRIQSWLQKKKISYHLGTIEDALKVYPQANRFNLSNIFEYMPQDLFEKQVSLLIEHSAGNARFCYWNLMVPRTMEYRPELESVPIMHSDKGFFYNRFYCFQKQG